MTTNRPENLYITLAEAIRRVQSRTDIPRARQVSWLGALRLYGRVEGRVSQTIHLDPRDSIETMDRASAPALGIAERSLRNSRCVFKTVMRELGILAPVRRRPVDIANPQWRQLIAMASPTHHPHRLVAFMAACDAQGIGPGEVTSETLETYLAERSASRGGKNVRADVAEVARLWNRYRLDLPAWPQTEISLRPLDLPRALSLLTYPATLQADARRFLEGVAPPAIGQLFGSSIQGQDGQIIVRPVLSPKTIEARRKGVRSLLWALVETGTPIEQVTSLDLLLVPDVTKRILEWHFRRLGQEKPTAGLAGYLDTLTAIAAYKNLGGRQRTDLQQLVKMARPKSQKELSGRNSALLTTLENRHIRRLLLEAPFTLMTEARKIRDGGVDQHGTYRSPDPGQAARLAATAVAIEIELHLPLRVLDLAALHLGVDLTQTDQGRRDQRWRIALNARKNGRRVETELVGKSAALLSEYVDKFKPLGPHPGSAWLFPHRDKQDHRPEGHFSEAISHQIQRLTGVDMNVHAFRCFAALLIVEENPHALDDIRSLLGHASFETAWRYYIRQNRLAAAVRTNERIENERRKLGRGR